MSCPLDLDLLFVLFCIPPFSLYFHCIQILQQAKIPLISQRECTRAMGYGSITNSMICAGHKNKQIDSCQGDSGGPLVCRKTDKSGQDVWYLWGVVSWGIDCATPGYYGVYASVETLGSWVQNTINRRTG